MSPGAAGPPARLASLLTQTDTGHNSLTESSQRE
jgi:hypothetical protein